MTGRARGPARTASPRSCPSTPSPTRSTTSSACGWSASTLRPSLLEAPHRDRLEHERRDEPDHGQHGDLDRVQPDDPPEAEPQPGQPGDDQPRRHPGRDAVAFQARSSSGRVMNSTTSSPSRGRVVSDVTRRRAPGSRRPRPRTRRAARPASAGPERRVERREVQGPQLGQRDAQLLDDARVLLGQRRSETVGSSV